MTTVLFGDVVATVTTHLRALGVPVTGKVPTSRPSSFLTVSRTGGPRRNQLVDEAQVTVDSWAESNADALALAERARQSLHSMTGTTPAGVLVVGVEELSGPAETPDLSEQPRYRQTFVIATRGS